MIEDINIFANRPVQQNNGFFTGDKIFLKQKIDGGGLFRAFSIEFSQNVFVEQDSSKNCKNYPNMQFESYSDCDQDFVRRSLQDVYTLQPYWAALDHANVTMNAFEHDYFKIEPSIFNLFAGATTSSCPLPCVTTKTFSSLVYESEWPQGTHESVNFLDLTPSPTVMITRTDFPIFALASALSSYGGSMGFWLGLGVVQLAQLFVGFLKNGITVMRKIQPFRNTICEHFVKNEV